MARRLRAAPFAVAADRLPARRLGVVGALLILVGLLVQTVQYWVLIFDVDVR